MYLLGIDGGGTKTQLALADEDCNVIRSIRADGCNPIDVGIEKSTDILRKAIAEICDGINMGDVVMFAGIAGGTSGDNAEKLRECFSEMGFARYDNGSDAMNLVAAGLGDGDGVTLIMGTGSMCIIQNKGKTERISGWGYLFDEGGSGYNVGRDAISAHFCAIDGIGKKTVISDIISEDYPDPQMLLKAAYDGGKRFIASFSPIVFEAAEKGDEVANDIIKRNMRVAADIIEAAVERFSSDTVKVVLTGGLTSGELAMRCLYDILKNNKKCQLEVLDCEPVMGALAKAKELIK